MLKTLVVAAAMAALPALAYAGCSSKSHQAMSCAEGSVWDAQSQTCIPQVNA